MGVSSRALSLDVTTSISVAKCNESDSMNDGLCRKPRRVQRAGRAG